MIAAARSASSVLTEILTVTPDFAEYAIFTKAATRPPAIDLPYNFKVWVVFDMAISVPSSGCKDKADESCSVAPSSMLARKRFG